MKKFVKQMMLILGCICALTLAGCSKDVDVEDKPVHGALILQPIATAPVVNVEAAAGLLETVCKVPGSSLSIIVADGEPWEYAAVEPEDIDKSLSSDMKKQILEERIQELVAAATSARAVNPETDLRTAVEMAARKLHSYRDDAMLEMVICGPFENTVDPLPMQDILLSQMDVNSVVDNLSENDYIVDLKNISITGYNLGDTCGQQKKFSNKDRASLEAFWTAFFEAGNAEKIEFLSDLPLELTYEDEGLPDVSTIPVVKTGSELQELEEKDMADGITFDETAIKFKKNTAELIDEGAARKMLSALADYMSNHNTKAILVGTTAKIGALKDSVKLSFERAKVLKALLVEDGVPKENLTAIGAGFLSCFYVNDIAEDGTLDEHTAPQNRACTWVNRNSDLVKKILNDPDYKKFMVE